MSSCNNVSRSRSKERASENNEENNQFDKVNKDSKEDEKIKKN